MVMEVNCRKGRILLYPQSKAPLGGETLLWPKQKQYIRLPAFLSLFLPAYNRMVTKNTFSLPIPCHVTLPSLHFLDSSNITPHTMDLDNW